MDDISGSGASTPKVGVVARDAMLATGSSDKHLLPTTATTLAPGGREPTALAVGSPPACAGSGNPFFDPPFGAPPALQSPKSDAVQVGEVPSKGPRGSPPAAASAAKKRKPAKPFTIRAAHDCGLSPYAPPSAPVLSSLLSPPAGFESPPAGFDSSPAAPLAASLAPHAADWEAAFETS